MRKNRMDKKIKVLNVVTGNYLIPQGYINMNTFEEFEPFAYYDVDYNTYILPLEIQANLMYETINTTNDKEIEDYEL
jgi:hypothetical protein